MKRLIAIGIFLFIVGIVLIHFPLFIAPFWPWSSQFDTGKLSSYGSFLAGYTGTWLLLLNITLLLFVQYRQALSEFERTFYQLLQIHHDNVQNFSYAQEKGQEAIDKLVRTIDRILNEILQRGAPPSIEIAINESYWITYYGYNTRAHNIMVRNLPGNQRNYFSLMSNFLYHTPEVYRYNNGQRDVMPGADHFLSKYLLHLEELARYVGNSDWLRKKEKTMYFRILKSQLSTSERGLIQIFCLTEAGATTLLKTLNSTYRFTEGLPTGFFEGLPEEFLND